MTKSMTLYLGYDGAYVFSRKPLFKKDADKEYPYLAPRTGRCFDIQPHDADHVFGHLKMKKFEVVRLEVRVPKRARGKRGGK